MKDFISGLEKKIEILYDYGGNASDEELKSIIDLIKVDDNIDFYKSFENQLSNLIDSEENSMFFDFITKINLNILDYIFFFIDKEGIKISSTDKKKKQKKENIKINSEDKEDNANKQINISMIKVNNIHDNKNNINENINTIQDTGINEGETNMNELVSNEANSSDLESNKLFSINENTFMSEGSSKEENKLDLDTKLNKTKSNNQFNLNTNENDIKNKVLNIENKLNENKLYEDKKLNAYKYKNLFIKKEVSFEDDKESRIIRFYGDDSEINGKSFEYDTVNYIFQLLFKISPNKDFSLIYNFCPDIEKINPIFKKYNLFTINKIQFDFLILNLKISELIDLLIDIYPGIHPNSKISLNIKDKNFPSLDDLNKLKEKKKNDNERIDILGEIGVNIFNEEEKCHQFLKYTKLIHNINEMIKSNIKDGELPYLLNLLHLNGNNKKLLLFFTNSSYSSYINIKNNNFLTIQKNLNIDSLLVFRNKSSLFRTRLLEKLYQKYKKIEGKNFQKNLDDKYERIIKQLFKSSNYEKVVKRLSNIEKKIQYIKTDLYKFVIENKKFIDLCYNIMKSLIDNEFGDISMVKFEQIKKTYFEKVMNIKIHPKKKFYIIFDKNNKSNDIKKSLTEELEKKKLFYKESDDLDVLIDIKRYDFKIIIFFVDDLFLSDNLTKLTSLKTNFHINKFNKIIFYLDDKDKAISIEPYKKVFDLNFDYIYNIDDLLKEIENIKENNIDLYEKHVKLVESEVFYKFLIEQYINIFNRKIYDNKKIYHDKNEILFAKINQDIQFLKTLDFDDNTSLSSETTNIFKNKFDDNFIKILIDNFLKKTRLVTDIKNILIEFEEGIDKNIKLEEDKKDKKNHYKIITEIINEIINNICIKIENEKIKHNLGVNKNNNENFNKHYEINNKNDINNDAEKKDESHSNKLEKISNLYDKIIECENLLKVHKKRNVPISKDTSDRNLLVLIEEIKTNLFKKIKNEIPIIIYIILQKSIIHEFEKIFIKNYLLKNN